MAAGAQLRAWSPYLLLLGLVLVANGLPPVRRALSAATSAFSIYDGPGGAPFVVSWIVTPGSLVFIAALAGALVQRASVRDLAAALGRTSAQVAWPAVTIVSIVALARVMTHSGMAAAIAVALAGAAGRLSPFIAPWIGALGAFLTGSDTSSNVLFGALQKHTAALSGFDPTWVAAANATGATAGKMISPQSIAVAVAATGQRGADGAILRRTLGYCALYTLALGLIVALGAAAR